MNKTTQTISPLHQRFLDDMRMRKLSPKTQSQYVRVVRKLAIFLWRSHDSATAEELRSYQLHLVDQGISPVSLNATITGLKFFFETTVGRGELMNGMQSVHVPHKLGIDPSKADEILHQVVEVASQVKDFAVTF